MTGVLVDVVVLPLIEVSSYTLDVGGNLSVITGVLVGDVVVLPLIEVSSYVLLLRLLLHLYFTATKDNTTTAATMTRTAASRAKDTVVTSIVLRLFPMSIGEDGVGDCGTRTEAGYAAVEEEGEEGVGMSVTGAGVIRSHSGATRSSMLSMFSSEEVLYTVRLYELASLEVASKWPSCRWSTGQLGGAHVMVDTPTH